MNVTGYPNGAAAPISCLNRAARFSPTELGFDCDGYTNGTSGSALLAGVDSRTRPGTVIGVIGGYQEGGDTNSVSYADRLGANVATMYRIVGRPVIVLGRLHRPPNRAGWPRPSQV